MSTRILIVQGHPDPAGGHFCHALAEAYRGGAERSGHAVDCLDVATLDFPLLRTKEDFEHGVAPPVIAAVQARMAAADHLVFLYPLWMGDMPAVLKGFLEQCLRPGFAFGPQQPDGNRQGGGLRGKSAHVVVTMGMPALIYRWYFGAHSLRSFRSNILRFAGIAPVRSSLVGRVEALKPEACAKWLARMAGLGAGAR